MSTRRTRRGFSLTEMVFVAALLGVVLTVPALILRTSSRAYSTGTNAGEAELASRRTMNTISERLQRSGLAGLVPPSGTPGVPYTFVAFRPAIGVVGGATSWGNEERIILQLEPGELADGADNDGDGLIDEGRVVWIEDFALPTQRSHVLCSRVARALEGEQLGNGVDDNGNGLADESGLLFAFDGERVSVALTIERRDSFGVGTRSTSRRVVSLRN